jgi:hypothetical protein
VSDAGRCFVVAPGEGRLIDLGDFEMRVKADAGSTDGVFSVLEATEPPGFGPPIHVHDDAAEAFYVLDGEYLMSLHGDEYRSQLARSCSSLRAFLMASESARRGAASSTSISRPR